MFPRQIAALPAALLAVLACTVIAPPVSAQGTDFPVWDGLGAAACDENFPAVAHNEDLDQFLVVFQRDNGTFGNWDLSAVRVSSTGATIGAPFTVVGTENDEIYPAIARNPTDNNYLVTFIRSNSTPGYFGDVWGVLVEHDGTVGTPFSIAAYPDAQYEPDVAYSVSARRYLVVWDEYQNPGPTFVRGQRVLPDGQTPGSRSNHRVSIDPVGYPPSAHQINPALAYSPSTADALVVWADNGHYTEPTAGEWGLWGRHWVAAIFADGLEDGDFRQWSVAVP